MKTIFSITLLLVLTAVGVKLYGNYQTGSERVAFRTGAVEQGDLVLTVEATGTLEPEEVIDVGAQVVGRIKEFGLDPRGETDPQFAGKPVDYRSEVKQGTILAVIDDAVYRAQRNQAKAAHARAIADLVQLKARLVQTDAEWQRAQRLRNLSVKSISATGKDEGVQIRGISDADFVLAKSNYEVAKANIDVGEAAIAQQASALELAETNLGYTVIKSPVDGTILDRRVNIGQTVVASFNAPSLFLIAQDLRRMQVWASVNEADIGGLKEGTPVSFTVDALPDEVFRGKVTQVRLNAKMTQNVVVYTVVITTDNSDLKLLPYLTANVTFEVNRREGVLTVPNAALRYTPRPELIVSLPAEAASPASSTAKSKKTDNRETIWIRQGQGIAPIEVAIGASDRSRTEVISDQLKPGMEVVLGEQQAGAAEQVNNPFAPKMPRSRPRS
ncbi:efflux RND transporter periplasmic adaptor subunit [Lacipirellula parvula]|uniref:Putative Co/Zn/Cd efflux system membrane fusion protein n=1 Tax=Lacipirellula parvula TaxID=2650471 RepID=A0A5K7XD04_9BACT|nr:efflux RND transporter periplasmic adaptor subunit [Lacipirellula parvula]BBO33852.1 putative Co/Zn/Cd efflux system membrane fusion protein [Lacipirellula parvula]